jgi:protein gp37
VELVEDRLTLPLKWRNPARIFVSSTSDLFHEKLPDAWIDRVFAVMALAPQHTFQCLTKRSKRMREYCSDENTPFRIAQAIDAMQGDDVGPEEIRPISGYPGYFASSLGVIYTEHRGPRRAMKPDVGEQGHSRVQLHREGAGRYGDRLLVHRVILETFVGQAPMLETQGRHLDRNPQNNAARNLQWGDQPSNWQDSKRHGTHRRYSKLTQSDANAIRQRHAAGETGEALAREFDISATQIRNIASGRQWNVEPPISWPLENCWLGVSCEDQTRADERIPDLLATPAAVRFISAEPLLGRIDFKSCWLSRMTLCGHCPSSDEGTPITCECANERLDQIIVGGESGPCARPMQVEWARSIVKQCQAARVSVFVKQMGANPVWSDGAFLNLRDRKGGDMAEWPEDLRVRQMPGAQP